jgi:hypothetical protein
VYAPMNLRMRTLAMKESSSLSGHTAGGAGLKHRDREDHRPGDAGASGET